LDPTAPCYRRAREAPGGPLLAPIALEGAPDAGTASAAARRPLLASQAAAPELKIAADGGLEVRKKGMATPVVASGSSGSVKKVKNPEKKVIFQGLQDPVWVAHDVPSPQQACRVGG
jgi:hypothetical protein